MLQEEKSGKGRNGSRREGRGSRQSQARRPENLNRPGIRSFFRSPEGKAFMWGAGAAILGIMLLPSAKKGARPILSKAVQGGLILSEQIQEVVANAREGLQDIVAEAHFEKLQETIAAETGASDPKP